ncbi:MAG: signal peptidase I [Bacilli bacterium]|jgi:signal peptidase I
MVKKIFTYFISILTTICFLLTFVIIILGIKANTSKNIVKVFGYSFSVVASDSMEPTIKVGEVITIKNVPFEEVGEGDIVVFWSNEYRVYIVHRVIEILDGDKLITKGDNPLAPIDSEYVTETNYFGIVHNYGKFLNIGRLILDYRDVVYGLIIILFIYIIVKEIISIILNLKKAKEEELKKESMLLKQRLYEEAKAKLRQEIMEERGKDV